MAVAVASERPIPGVPEQVATRMAFFIVGFAVAAWAPLIPYAKERLGVDEGTLGLLLLCLGIGSIVSMPLTGTLAARFGCRRVIWGATFVMCVALPCLALASTVPRLALAILAFGAGVGTVDVTVNIQAVMVEKAAGRAMMSGFHGFLSLICFLAEGAILDWGAVFLTSVRNVAPSYAGWGYTIFSIAMTVCRLTGDRVVQALGSFRIILFGGLCAAAGLAVAVLAPSWLVALIGFGMVGFGASNIVPVLFSAAGRQTAMPPNLAIAAMTFLGYGNDPCVLGPQNIM